MHAIPCLDHALCCQSAYNRDYDKHICAYNSVPALRGFNDL